MVRPCIIWRYVLYQQSALFSRLGRTFCSRRPRNHNPACVILRGNARRIANAKIPPVIIAASFKTMFVKEREREREEESAATGCRSYILNASLIASYAHGIIANRVRACACLADILRLIRQLTRLIQFVQLTREKNIVVGRQFCEYRIVLSDAVARCRYVEGETRRLYVRQRLNAH